MAWRDLFESAAEAREQRLDTLPCRHRTVAEDLLAVEVVCRCRASKRERRLVPFRTALVQRGETGGSSEQEHEQPGCKRIERACMPDAFCH